jgi:uncharacterized protein
MNRQQAEAIAERAGALDLVATAAELGVGRLLLADIVEQLQRPGRDPRDDLPKPFFKKGVLKLEDLEVGMELLGSVLNVVDFGAFVDIGLHDSGLVHISQLSSRYVRDPHDVVSVGQIVPIWVLELDKARRRVALTMIPPAERERQRLAKERKESRKESQKARAAQAAKDAAAREQRPAPPAGGPGGERPPRPAGGRGQQRARPPRQQGPRTYVASGPSGPPKPISKAMKTGKEPLRTFGDLKQFFESKNIDDAPPSDKPPAEGTA